MKKCGEAMELDLFPEGCGGSIPTSPLQLRYYEIGTGAALEAYKRWHYLGETQLIATVNFGVYFEQEFMGCISYGPPNATDLKGFWDRKTQSFWYEIKRMALSPECPKNSESRTIAITTKLLRKKAKVKGIVTYADTSQNHEGTIYKASGYKCHGLTEPKKDFYVNGKIQQRGKTAGVAGEWRDRPQKILFSKVFDDTL